MSPAERAKRGWNDERRRRYKRDAAINRLARSLEELVALEREAQGLPPRVSDAAVLDKLADLMLGPKVGK